MTQPAANLPPLAPRERWRLRRDLTAIFVVSAILLGFAIAETPINRLGDSFSPTSSVTFFLLINLNVILLGLLIFLIARNLAKLVFDRRRRIFGSALRTRLVLAFVGLTILPAIMLFVVAQGFLTATIDHWFGERVERSLEAAAQIAENYYQSAGNDALEQARRVAGVIQSRGMLDSSMHDQLTEYLDEARANRRLAAIEVIDSQGSLAFSAGDPESEARPRPATSELDELLKTGKDFLRVDSSEPGDVIRAGVAIFNDAGEVVGCVLVDRLIPEGLSRGAVTAVRSFHEYSKLEVLERPIDSAYTVFFWSLTLVVLFTATWFGFRLAREITEPIGQLGAGMQQVAAGNLAYHAEVSGDDDVSTLIRTFNEMTDDLRSSHTALEERHRYIESVLENVAAGVVSVEPGGTVATLNPAASELLGMRPEDVQGRHWHEIFSSTQLRPVRDLIARLSAKREKTGEVRLKLLRHGKESVALVTATTQPGEEGEPSAIILFFEDVTHHTQVERMNAWREVARRIAHEIKNPLTPIQLSAQRLRKRYATMLGPEEGAVLEECTRTIDGQVEQLKALVNEFSRFARLPAVAAVPDDLNAVAEEALVLYREGHRGIRFEFRPATDLPPIDIDRNAITRVVINMLDNAVAACSSVPAGEAIVEVVTSWDARMEIARLEIADNGSGMSPEVKARAFEPYFSTKKDGSGLGLAIVSAIVSDHQAYLRLYDNHPRGTRVVIEFPVRGAIRRAVGESA